MQILVNYSFATTTKSLLRANYTCMEVTLNFVHDRAFSIFISMFLVSILHVTRVRNEMKSVNFRAMIEANILMHYSFFFVCLPYDRQRDTTLSLIARALIFSSYP